VFVKICGITNEEDALMAVALGADAVGFVFAPSPRQVSVGAVRDIARRLPPEVLTVGVFRDQSPSFVLDTVQQARIRSAQLHGHETPADAALIRPHVEALLVAFTAGDPALAHVDDYGADAILLDSHAPGSGQVFDWSLAEGVPVNRRVILAGGLDPSNVAAGIREVRPWGVDVSTGVEVAGSPGRKDPRKVRDFIRAARDAAPEPEQAETGDPDGRGPFDWADAGL
jgi:phosphoribosylanthranilate isomerase